MAFIFSLSGLLISCANNNTKLPYLGNPIIQGNKKEYPRISSFSFINQDSIVITDKTFENKIYVTDFIFLSCPTICPTMTSEMLRVYQAYHSNPNVYFLSHTVDPLRDSIPLLKSYSENLGINSKKWFFVSGQKDSIYSIAEKSYFSIAYPDSTAPGGFVHSGALLLIDKNKYIRGVYDGTNKNESSRLKTDIETLLKEQF